MIKRGLRMSQLKLDVNYLVYQRMLPKSGQVVDVSYVSVAGGRFNLRSKINDADSSRVEERSHFIWSYLHLGEERVFSKIEISWGINERPRVFSVFGVN